MTMQINGSVGITFPDGTIQTTAATGGSGTVTAVSAVAPLASSGGATPAISLSGIVSPAHGGTGTAGLTGLLYGNGAGAATAATALQVATVLGTQPVTTATNLAGGAVNQIPFQTAAGATSFITAPGSAGVALEWDGTGFVWAAPGSGSVTGVSVVSANGFAGTVATPSTTPAITLTTTITGVLKGNGTAISAAAASDITTLLGSNPVTAATNLFGGAVGSLPYQSAANTTSFLAAGTNGQVLTLVGGVPAWGGAIGQTTAALSAGTGLDTTPVASTFNGSVAVTFKLADTAVTTGTYGSATTIPVITIDQQGRITAASSAVSVALTYKGTWNATTNTPTLANGTGTQGSYYVCNVAGTVDFGAGPVTFAIGDWAIYNGTTWDQIANSQTTSVANFTITGIPANELILGGGSSPLSGLGYGTVGQVLLSGGAGAAPVWTTPAATVVSFAGGTTGLTPASATTGAITLGGVLVPANGGTGVANSFTITVTGANQVLDQPVNSGATPTFTGTNFTGIPASALAAGTVISPANGGTGINNGANTLTLSGSYTLDQSVASGATPTFVGTNFSGTATSLTAGLATAIAGGAANQIPYQTAAGVTSFAGPGTVGQALVANSSGVPTWTGVVNSFSGGTTGLTPAAPTTGDVTLGGILSILNGGTNGQQTPTAGGVAYGDGAQYLFTTAGTAGQYLQSNGTGAPTWSTIASTVGSPAYFGAFQDNNNQNAAAINTKYYINLSTTDIANGVSVVNDGLGNPTKITFANGGTYTTTFSIQFANTDTADINIANVWLEKNGVTVPESNTQISIPAKHSGVNGSAVMTVNFFNDVVPGDFIQVAWSANATNVFIAAFTASAPYPDTPGIILTTAQLSQIGLGYAGMTSTTSMTIGTGSQTFTTSLSDTQTAYTIGTRVRVASNAVPGDFMEGVITAFTGTSMTVNVDLVGGSGTFAAWDLSVAGQPGAASTTANNIAGGAALDVVYQTGANTTGFVTAPTVSGNVLTYNGTGLVWSAPSGSTTNALTAGTGLDTTPAATTFNGSAPVTFKIANTAVTAASYGAAATIPTFTVNAQGQLTAAADVAIAINGNQITSGVVGATYGGTGINNGAYTITVNNASQVLDQSVASGAAPTFTGTNFTGIPGAAISSGVISPANGGTGVNNGTNTLTLSGSYTLDQSVASGAAPVLSGANFSATTIPNSALVNSAMTINGVSVSLGATATITANTTNALTAGTGLTTTPLASTFNGSAAVTFKLADTAVTPGTYGSAVTIPVLTIDQQGRITAATTANSPALVYKGTWDASTNTPALADGSGTQGNYYVCNVAGTVNFGSGPLTFNVGDWAIYNGSVWQQVFNSQTTSVSSFTITGIAANEIVLGGGGSPLSGLGYGVSGQILTSGGAGAAPVWANSVANVSGGAAGSLLYQTAANTTGQLAIGTTGQILTVSAGGLPVWSTNAATSATNLAGGAAGSFPYQSATGTTSFLAAGTAGQVIISGGAGAPTWANGTISGVALGNNLFGLTIGTGLSGTSYNGSAAVTVAIANTAVTAASYGAAATIPTFTVNAQGQLTAAADVAIAINANQITSGAITNAQLANSSITFGATAAALGSTVSAFNAVSIGQTTAAAGTFTALSATTSANLSPTGTVVINPTTTAGSTMDGITIGATTPEAVTGTVITATQFIGVSGGVF